MESSHFTQIAPENRRRNKTPEFPLQAERVRRPNLLSVPDRRSGESLDVRSPRKLVARWSTWNVTDAMKPDFSWLTSSCLRIFYYYPLLFLKGPYILSTQDEAKHTPPGVELNPGIQSLMFRPSGKTPDLQSNENHDWRKAHATLGWTKPQSRRGGETKDLPEGYFQFEDGRAPSLQLTWNHSSFLFSWS